MCEEVEFHLAYRWFCRLDLDDKVPDHSTFSVNRHGRFRDSDLFRQVFEAVVRACMGAGLVKGEAFAVDASVMAALSILARVTRAREEASGAMPTDPARPREPAGRQMVRSTLRPSPIPF
jgi:IS5 family transposase